MSIINKILEPIVDPMVIVQAERDMFLNKILEEQGMGMREEAIQKWYEKFKEFYEPYQNTFLEREELAKIKYNANEIVIKYWEMLRAYETPEYEPNIRIEVTYDNRRP